MNLEDIEQRISQIELNQHRLAILTTSAPEKHKAFDRECLTFNLTFEQEAAVRQVIVDFLDSSNCDSSLLVEKVSSIVGHDFIAKGLISAFKKRETAIQRWKEIDPDNNF